MSIVFRTAFYCFFIAAFLVAGLWWFLGTDTGNPQFSSLEAGFEELNEIEDIEDEEPSSLFENWQRPEGPIRVGLQAGHWRNSEVPEELGDLKRSGGGAVGGGKSEWEVVLNIAELTAQILREMGIDVDILPATIPPSYYADAFVAIHADGNISPSVSGFKVARPRFDTLGKSSLLGNLLYEEYEKATGLRRDSNVTRQMRGYYAFNWRKYEHSIHQMTPAVIIETGFLTSPRDREILISNPKKAADGIASALLKFLSY